MRSRLFRVVSRLVVIPLVFSMVLTTVYAPAMSVQRAHAGAGGIVYDPTNWIQNAASAALSRVISSLTDSLVIKEYVLDGIAFAIINMMIQQMSQDIISWINSGFQGDPAFIRNFDGFLTGIADRAVGEFIGGTELGAYLCSPFRIQIQAALEIQYTATRNFGAPSNACTLSGIEANIQNFLDGDVVMGSWDDWFRITQNPQYNTHGAMLMAQEKLSMNIANARGQQTSILGWGDGMLSSQVCNGGEEYNPDTDQMYCPGGYSIVTPGTAIEDSLNEALAAPGQRIQMADEINEIFAALFNQLVTQAFNGIGGLLGLTGSGSSAATNPYYTSLYTQPSGTSQTEIGTLIQDAITTETRYRTLQQTMVSMLTNAANYRQNTYPSDPSCHSGVLPSSLQNELNAALANITEANVSITTLNQIYAEYLAAGSDPDLIRAVYQRFIDMQSSGDLHTQAENNAIEALGIPALQDAINDFTAEIDQACTITTGGGGV